MRDAPNAGRRGRRCCQTDTATCRRRSTEGTIDPEVTAGKRLGNMIFECSDYLPTLEQVGDGESNVFRDLAQKSRRNITTGMKRNGGRATRTVTKLFV